MTISKPMMLLLYFLVPSAIESTELPTATNAPTTTFPPLLRGRHHYPPHRGLLLPKKSNSNSNSNNQQSTHQGCLGYSESELSQSWIFSGDAPSCSWAHSTGGDSNNNSGESGSDSTSNATGESSYDGEGDTYGGGWDDDSGSNGTDNNMNDDDAGNGETVNDDQTTDDEVVVANEKVYNDDDQFDPIDDFDIQVCDTYENLWIWDLALSCENITQENDLFADNAGCNCPFAQELLENGLVSCDDFHLCPGDCRVCSVCLSLLGCGQEPIVPRVWRSLSTLSVLYIVGAAVGLLVFGLVAHYARNHYRNTNNDDLDQNLLDTKSAKVNPSMLYMHQGDLAWKPLPSDEEYAALQQQGMSLQPTVSMSTASTGKMSNSKNRAQSIAVGSFQDSLGPQNPVESTMVVPSVVDAVRHEDGNVTLGVSPIQTMEESSEDASGDEDDKECSDGCNDDFDDEASVQELSPRTMDSIGERGNDESNGVV